MMKLISDGNWSDWSDPTPCEMCLADGSGGKQYHTRNCSMPQPAYEGDACTPTAENITEEGGIQTEREKLNCNCPVSKFQHTIKKINKIYSKLPNV